ncbi:MAG: DUF1990 domain-containing protein [Microbacteriaceae bacterium]|nr:DUF1990 domain-containing protein [Microbacteriaceae bacterium]
MSFPPRGYRPTERRARIGHGRARWEHAALEVMTWCVQRRAGIRVTPLEAPAEATDAPYRPIAFQPDGTPIPPDGSQGEVAYAPDGGALLGPGDTVLLGFPWFPLRLPARVVYVIDEPLRKGFAYGTLPGHPESGEAAFAVEYRDDDSVWLIQRSFSRPSAWIYWVGYPVLRFLQEVYQSRYERSLAGPIDDEDSTGPAA